MATRIEGMCAPTARPYASAKTSCPATPTKPISTSVGVTPPKRNVMPAMGAIATSTSPRLATPERSLPRTIRQGSMLLSSSDSHVPPCRSPEMSVAPKPGATNTTVVALMRKKSPKTVRPTSAGGVPPAAMVAPMPSTTSAMKPVVR